MTATASVNQSSWVQGESAINKAVGIIKIIFKWAAENELISASIYLALQTVSGLKRGRSEAKEPKAVAPVPDKHVDTVLTYLSRQVRAMIELQRLTGMRPSETAMVRGSDIDMSGRIWSYVPQSHKTEHHGRSRTIYLGPRAKRSSGHF